MAIRVVIRGKPPADKLYNVLCERCKSRLECNRDDFSFTEDGRNGMDVSIKCPVCNHSHLLLNALETYEVQPAP